VATPDASLRGVTVAPDGELWCTENAANKIGRMAPNGKLIGEYPIPAPGAGARAILAIPDGRLFFSAFDIGAIGEVIPRRR
jgi:virginiamycin B lyase